MQQAIGPANVEPEILEPSCPLEEVEALKSALAEVLHRVTRLAASLKAYGQEHKVVRSAMDSLRQLTGKI